MAANCSEIGQEARVLRVEPKKLVVSLYNAEACTTCKLKKVCQAGKARIVETQKPDFEVKVGDKVLIFMEEKQGFLALFLGYILPFIILMATLIIVKVLTNNDGLAGLAALGSLVPYYLVLYLLRNVWKRKFTFTIKPA